MSDFYATSNLENSFLLFNKRQYFRLRMRGISKNIVNFNFGEKLLYGRVDSYFSPIEPYSVSMAPLGNVTDRQNAQGAKAMAFVADLFNEMARQFEKAVATGQILKDDKYLSQLKAYKAYQPPRKLYRDYHRIYSESIINKFIRLNIQVLDFPQFIKEFMDILSVGVAKMPYTYPGFIKSRQCTILSSGLAIEIADLKYSNDEQKITDFLTSPNWNYFVNACNQYGFMIDENIPWRIVMDIAAPEVHKISERYGAPTRTAILSTLFQTPGVYQEKRFIRDLLNIYNTVTAADVRVQEYCNASGKTITRVQVPRSYESEEQLRESYNEHFWNSVYLNIRLMEEKPAMTKHDRARLVKDQILTFNNHPPNWTFERVINKMFDKPGSYGYYYKHAMAKSDMAFKTGQATAREAPLESYFESQQMSLAEEVGESVFVAREGTTHSHDDET